MCKIKTKIKTSFADEYPDYAKYWSPDNDQNPSSISYSSHKKYDFVCDYGHVTTKSPNKISSLKGKCFSCRECLKKSFSEVYPDYSKHWSPKNNIDPKNVVSGSCSKFYFTCKNGHTFQRSPNYISKLKTHKFNCVECQTKTFLDDFPDYAKHWSPKNNVAPENVASRSHKTFKFICPKGHELEKSPKHLYDLKDKSFFCSTCTPIRTYNIKARKSFSDEYPDYAKYWSPDNNIQPTEVTSGSKKTYKFICKKGHVTEKIPNSMSRLKNKNFTCKLCDSISFNEAYPEYVKYWSPDNNISPEDISSASGQTLKFTCNSGHSFFKTPNSISKLKNKYFYCLECNTISFSEAYPSLLPYWSPKNKQSPYEVSQSSSSYFDFICDNGHTMKKQLSSIKKCEQFHCNICVGIKTTYDTRLDISYPLLLKEWDYHKNKKTPDLYSSRSNKKVWWKCERNHSWNTTVSSRTGEKNNIYGGGKCPHCYTRSKSRPELIIFSELHQFFKNVISGYNMEGKELDIYIKDIKFAIEYDGHYYHKNKLQADKLKNKICDENKINIIRVREKGLRRISKDDYIHNPQSDLFEVIVYILKYIIKNYKISKKKALSIKKYIENKKATNEDFFNSILYKNMIKEVKSKEKINCYSSLNPLGIQYYGNQSNYNAIWECPHCNSSWNSSIRKFTLKNCNYCGENLSKEKEFNIMDYK